MKMSKMFELGNPFNKSFCSLSVWTLNKNIILLLLLLLLLLLIILLLLSLITKHG